MSYLVDTDWVADYLKGRPAAVTLLDRFFSDGLALSIITYGEVYEGIYYCSDPKRNEAIFRQLLKAVRIVGISRPVARQFAEIRGVLRARGDLISAGAGAALPRRRSPCAGRFDSSAGSPDRRHGDPSPYDPHHSESPPL
ncbi:MAG: type II toxin-antitoxin system VapC family toxin [Chloroflexi bacterium]|nr:type II toxin-antitoxin system VapC family toxin [Chloroflexota bacterium]